MKNNSTPIRTEQEIFEFLIINKSWISAFTCADGSFTSSLCFCFDTRALWAFWPQCEYNITQSLADINLLKAAAIADAIAINIFFKNKGTIHERVGNVGQQSFRDRQIQNDIIIPYFQEHPQIGLKSQAYYDWVKLVNICNSLEMTNRDQSGRDAVIKFAEVCKDLNSYRNNVHPKQKRQDYIIEWLKNLETIPTKENKEELKQYLKEHFSQSKSLG